MIGGTAISASFSHRSAMLLATASAIALLSHVPSSAAQECSGAPPSDIATPAALYEALRDRTDAQLLTMGFAQQPAADCAWVYEVKMLTMSGSVVELDFAARDLDLIGARGPDNDKEVARLVHGLGGDAGTIVTRNPKGNGSGQGASGGEAGDGSDDGHSGSGSGSSGGDDGGHGDEGGEGGNSGGGSDNSGSGGGEGGEGGGGEGGGGEGGGGEGGEGGGD